MIVVICVRTGQHVIAKESPGRVSYVSQADTVPDKSIRSNITF
jgi:hypothetical protein